MKAFLENLLPRIKQYSQSLDKEELFVDKPWVFVDEQDNHQKYIFRRNGELIISKNGQVTMGKWEYIAPAQSLLIDRITDKVLLNQAFIDSAVMLLRRDGSKNEVMPLVNELLVPDLDVVSYLDRFEKQKHHQYLLANNIKTYKLNDGRILEACCVVDRIHYEGLVEGMTVYFDGLSIDNGVLTLAEEPIVLAVKRGIIDKIFRKTLVQTNSGVLEVHTRRNLSVQNDNLVFKDSMPAPDGKYHAGTLWNIVVKDGKVQSQPMW